jgi:hypothetical protein
MDAFEFHRIMKIISQNGFKSIRINPMISSGFDILPLKEGLGIIIDYTIDKDFLILYSGDDYSKEFMIKFSSFDNFFKMKAFW